MELHNKLKKRVLRRFSEAWLTDERFKSWIHKVSFDETLFHCTVCNKNFSCCLSLVKKHAESEFHKKNIERNTSLLEHTNASAISIEQFKSWLCEVEDDTSLFFCTICDKILSRDLSQIYSHAESEIHKDRMHKDLMYRDQIHCDRIYKNQIHNDQIHKDQIHEKLFETCDIKIEPTCDIKIEPTCDIKIEQEDEMQINENMQIDENMQINENIKIEEIMQTDKNINIEGNMQINENMKPEEDMQINEDVQINKIRHVQKSYLPFDVQQKSAEIRFASLIADQNIPFETAKAILHFFQDIGRNSRVLENMDLS